jgi:hypothetical protein
MSKNHGFWNYRAQRTISPIPSNYFIYESRLKCSLFFTADFLKPVFSQMLLVFLVLTCQ